MGSLSRGRSRRLLSNAASSMCRKAGASSRTCRCGKISISAPIAGAARTAEQNRQRVFYDFSAACASGDGQQAGTLSGGEQQMLAIGRGLMAEPRLHHPR